MRINFAINVVIAFELGALGNQLFQYAAIKLSAPNATVLFIGMSSLAKFLDCLGESKVSYWHKISLLILKRIGRIGIQRLAGKGRLFSLISENCKGCKCNVQLEKGLFPCIAVLNGFFQDEQIPTAVTGNVLAIDKVLLKKASDWITSQTNTSSLNRYFVHIRRGDYTHWPSRSAPAVLSSAWYLAQMKRIKDQNQNAHFFIFSDDLPYVNEMLDGTNNIIVSKGNELTDLAAMSLCHGGGILSASTFSWWGAYYARRHDTKSLFIAPKLWAGWRQDRWYPQSIKTTWIQYVEAY
jgi:hypothetical protein